MWNAIHRCASQHFIFLQVNLVYRILEKHAISGTTPHFVTENSGLPRSCFDFPFIIWWTHITLRARKHRRPDNQHQPHNTQPVGSLIYGQLKKPQITMRCSHIAVCKSPTLLVAAFDLSWVGPPGRRPKVECWGPGYVSGFNAELLIWVIGLRCMDLWNLLNFGLFVGTWRSSLVKARAAHWSLIITSYIFVQFLCYQHFKKSPIHKIDVPFTLRWYYRLTRCPDAAPSHQF